MADEEARATLRETIEDSIAQHSEPEPVVTATPDAGTTETPAEQRPGRTAGRARAPDGKLLPGKPVKPDSAAQPQTPDAGAATTAQPAAVLADPVLPPIQRPSSWPKEMWPIWEKLAAGTPLTAQEQRQAAEFNVKRETQFATGVSTYKQIADTAKPVMDAIAPFQADLDRHGIQAPQMVHALLSSHRTLALGSPQQKLGLFAKLANDYGIPIQALYDQNAQAQYFASAPAQQAQQPQAPAQDINKLVEQAIVNREVTQTIAAMASNKEKYPFFPYVRVTMGQILEANPALTLDEAYAQSLDDPQHAIFGTVQQQQQAQQAEQQRRANAQATVTAAKANAVSPRSATPASAGGPANGKPSVREALKEATASVLGSARV